MLLIVMIVKTLCFDLINDFDADNSTIAQ